MRLFRLLRPVLGLFLLLQINAFGQQPMVITGRVETPVYPIAIDSADANAKALAGFAFNTHGAFRQTAPAQAAYVIVLTPGGNQCQVKIVTGQPAQVLMNATANGDSPTNAVLKACDLAVKQITNKPGYFAGQIAFTSNREGKPQIWLGDLFFRSARPLTSNRFLAQRPYISPDGRLVFFRSYERGFPDIYRYDTATNSATVFAGYKGTNAGGAVSPNGQQVALTLSWPGNMELYLQDVNKRSEIRRISRNRAAEADPAWSPDGRRLIVTSDQDGGPQLFEVPANGGPMTRLRTNISGYCAEANWNPLDEKQVVFTASTRGGYQLALYEFGGGNAKWLTSVSGDAKEPVWLNDGRHILFTIESGGKKQLAIIDSLNPKKVTPVSPQKFGNASQASFAY